MHKDFLENNSVISQTNFLESARISINSCISNESISEEKCYGNSDCINRLCLISNSKSSTIGYVSIVPLDNNVRCDKGNNGVPPNIDTVLSLGYISTILLLLFFIVIHFINGTKYETNIGNMNIIFYTILKFMPIFAWSYITSFAIRNELQLRQNQTEDIFDIKQSKETLLLVFYILEAFFFGITYLVTVKHSIIIDYNE